MKYRKVQNLLHQVAAKSRALCLCFTVATALTTTGCTMQFRQEVIPSTESNPVTVHIENLKQASAVNDTVQTAAEMIADADLQDPAALAQVTEQIQTAAEVVATENPGYEFETATLVRVVDGDTLVVEINNEDYKVRLIGVNTPESVAPDSYRTENTTEGVLASDYTKNLLKDVTTVYLDKDTSDTDRYGRLLRYVWLEIPEDKYNVNEVATKMLNGILVLDNVAEVATYEPDTAYAETFEYINGM